MKKMIISFCISIAPLYFTLSMANPDDFTKLDRIAVVVNNDIITQSQLANEIAQAKKQIEHANTPMPSDAELRKKVLDHLIDKSLQLQLAKQKNIKASDEEVQKAIESVAAQNHLKMEQLKPALESSGLNFPEFQNRIREQILFQHLQQQEVASRNISVTDAEVTAYMEKNQGKMQNYSAFHVLDVVTPDESKATSAAKFLRQKSDSSDLPKEVQAQTNDLGWGALTEFPSLFNATIASLRVGEVSKPIKAPNGYHVLKLLDAKGDRIKLTKKDAQNLVFQEKANVAVKQWLEDLRKTAYIQIVK